MGNVWNATALLRATRCKQRHRPKPLWQPAHLVPRKPRKLHPAIALRPDHQTTKEPNREGATPEDLRCQRGISRACVLHIIIVYIVSFIAQQRHKKQSASGYHLLQITPHNYNAHALCSH